MRYRRSTFLINRPFQLRFSFYTVSWLTALSFVYPVIIYNLFGFFFHYVASDPMGPPVAGLLKTRQEILWLLILFQVIFLAVTFLISVFMSHRIAGPLYKLGRFFEQTKAGNLQHELRFRKRDHFQDLAEQYNEMIRGLRGLLETNIGRIGEAVARIEKSSEGLDPSKRREIEDALATLREVREKIPH
jgi:methyl-accepting chemotaxis protein